VYDARVGWAGNNGRWDVNWSSYAGCWFDMGVLLRAHGKRGAKSSRYSSGKSPEIYRKPCRYWSVTENRRESRNLHGSEDGVDPGLLWIPGHPRERQRRLSQPEAAGVRRGCCGGSGAATRWDGGGWWVRERGCQVTFRSLPNSHV
jgi:hypothetical protein